MRDYAATSSHCEFEPCLKLALGLVVERDIDSGEADEQISWNLCAQQGQICIPIEREAFQAFSVHLAGHESTPA